MQPSRRKANDFGRCRSIVWRLREKAVVLQAVTKLAIDVEHPRPAGVAHQCEADPAGQRAMGEQECVCTST